MLQRAGSRAKPSSKLFATNIVRCRRVAHRVLGHGEPRDRRAAGHPHRRRGPALPAPRQRACAGRGTPPRSAPIYAQFCTGAQKPHAAENGMFFCAIALAQDEFFYAWRLAPSFCQPVTSTLWKPMHHLSHAMACPEALSLTSTCECLTVESVGILCGAQRGPCGMLLQRRQCGGCHSRGRRGRRRALGQLLAALGAPVH